MSDVTPRVAECCATVWLDCVCSSVTHPWTCGLPCNTIEDASVQDSGFSYLPCLLRQLQLLPLRTLQLSQTRGTVCPPLWGWSRAPSLQLCSYATFGPSVSRRPRLDQALLPHVSISLCHPDPLGDDRFFFFQKVCQAVLPAGRCPHLTLEPH